MEQNLLKNLDAVVRRQLADLQLNGGFWHQRPLNLSGFCPTHLGHWIALCRTTDVPHIPAEPIAGAPRDVLALWESASESEDLRTFFKSARRWIEDHEGKWMVRWPFCAGEYLKYHMQSGQPEWRSDFADPRLDDMRFCDLLMDFPYSWVQLFARPWTEPAIIDGYPVEFRVYVTMGISLRHVAGISSYYPQRPLPSTPEVLRAAADAERMTERLIHGLEDHSVMVMPDGLGRSGFTADFMLTATGETVFIEGGPEFGRGAHPCCFPPNISEIKGLALAPLPGSPCTIQ